MQTILITGATRGIGLAAAKALIARGAHVIMGSRDAEKAAATASSLGGNASSLCIDVTRQDSVEAAAAEIQRRHGQLDVLVNNGAILLDHYGSIMELRPELLMQTLDTNLVGTLRLTQALLPLLPKTGRIINVSSGAGQLQGEPQAWAPAYSISKTALNMLTQQLTAALPHLAINSMCPGWCRTEMGGEGAPRSAEEGADTLVWLALDAPHSLRGSFVKDRQVIDW
jgi:NAD(P)-dependent dehydrogenase (short-subunit alcohol dehydrogenase family)